MVYLNHLRAVKDCFEIDLDQRSRSTCKRSRSGFERSSLVLKRSRSLIKDQDIFLDLYKVEDQDKHCDLQWNFRSRSTSPPNPGSQIHYLFHPMIPDSVLHSFGNLSYNANWVRYILRVKHGIYKDEKKQLELRVKDQRSR